MRRLFIALCILASCGQPNEQTLQTQIAGATNTAILYNQNETKTAEAWTKTPTPISTPVPSIEIPPTPTEAVPKEGDVTTENGYTYTGTVIRDAEGNGVLTGDYRPLAVNVPFWDLRGNYFTISGETKPAQDVANITVNVANDAGANTIVAIKHTQSPEPNIQPIDPPMNEVVHGKFFQHFGISKDFKEFYRAMQEGTLKYSVFSGVSEQEWYPSPTHGTTIYIPKYDEATMTKENGYLAWSNIFTTHEFLSKFLRVNEQGNAEWIIVSKTPLDELDSSDIALMTLYPSATMIDKVGKDLNQNGGFDPFLQTIFDKADDTNPPYIEVQRQP